MHIARLLIILVDPVCCDYRWFCFCSGCVWIFVAVFVVFMFLPFWFSTCSSSTVKWLYRRCHRTTNHLGLSEGKLLYFCFCLIHFSTICTVTWMTKLLDLRGLVKETTTAEEHENERNSHRNAILTIQACKQETKTWNSENRSRHCKEMLIIKKIMSINTKNLKNKIEEKK